MYLFFSIATSEPGQRETVMLSCPNNKNPYYILHKLGVEYAMSPEGSKVRDKGLTFETLFNHLTPEMLAPYGMEIRWPDREATPLEEGRQIVSHYEIHSHMETRAQEHRKAAHWQQKLYTAAERYARKLEKLKGEGHPLIATWDSSRISVRSISWAYQCVKAGDLDTDKFLEKRLADAMRKAGLPPQDAGGTDEQNIAQSA